VCIVIRIDLNVVVGDIGTAVTVLLSQSGSVPQIDTRSSAIAEAARCFVSV